MSGVSMALRVAGWSMESVAIAMLPALFTDLAAGQEEWKAFGLCCLMVAFVGAAMILSVGSHGRDDGEDAEVRAVILSVILSTIGIIWAASLPFAFGEADCSIVDAVFEAVAGVTTSGGTIFFRLSDLPPGLLLWRGLLQWLGGAWALMLGIAILPFLQVGGMAFFRSDAFAGLAYTRRAKKQGLLLVGLYVGLSFLLMLLLWMAGMSSLDAVIHAMGIVSTGGASSWNTSLGHYNRVAIDIIVLFGMIISGLPFPLVLAAVRGNIRALFEDAQVRWYLGVMLTGSIILGWWGMRHWGWSMGAALRDDSIAVVSAVTGSGYTTQASLIWTGFPAVILLFLATLGGCAGSTSGGLKIFRFQAVLSEIWVQMGALIRPHAIRTAKVDGRVLYRATRNQIMGWVFIYTASFAALSWGLGALGLDALTSISAAISALANAQLSLGAFFSHSGGYASMPDGAKVLLSIGMVLGRLEILPALVLFTSTFWRR